MQRFNWHVESLANDSFANIVPESRSDAAFSGVYGCPEEESSLKIPPKERLAMTEEIESLLLMTFKTFDENRSGWLTRLHRL
jgi:hypothetical protein